MARSQEKTRTIFHELKYCLVSDLLRRWPRRQAREMKGLYKQAFNTGKLNPPAWMVCSVCLLTPIQAQLNTHTNAGTGGFGSGVRTSIP